MSEFWSGQRVVYRAYPNGNSERGVVVRWNASHTYVFVSFDGRPGVACRPADLKAEATS